jgi:hypothetical protein
LLFVIENPYFENGMCNQPGLITVFKNPAISVKTIKRRKKQGKAGIFANSRYSFNEHEAKRNEVQTEGAPATSMRSSVWYKGLSSTLCHMVKIKKNTQPSGNATVETRTGIILVCAVHLLFRKAPRVDFAPECGTILHR